MADKQHGAADVAMGWGILACIFAALGYLVWWSFATEIKSGIRWVRFAEVWAVSQFLPEDATFSWKGQEISYEEVRALAPTLPGERIDMTFLGLMSTAAFQPLKWVFVILIGGMGVWALTRGPGTEHRQVFTLDGLIGKQAQNFPYIQPFVTFNPASQPPRPPGSPVPAELPLFAEALGPEEWIAYNNIPVPNGKLEEAGARKAFARQLGPRWKGAKALPAYKQVLLAAFCLKASRKRAEADTMLGRLSRCWSHDKGLNLRLDKTLVRDAHKVLRNADLASKTLANCNQHAWQTTALLRALLTAREEGGVLAPAQFLWLRGHDRALWYPLNNLGRHSYHMEALGAMAHFKAEKMAKRPIPKPKVDDAVTSIAEYMASDRARPIPQLNYKGSKKSGIKTLKTA